MRLRAPFFVLVQLIGVALLGCARTAEERQLESMRDDIDRIQEERDGTDPPAPWGEAVPSKAPVETAPPSAPAPAAEVVRVGIQEDAVADDYADPDDITPRPLIRLSGTTRGGVSQQSDEAADPAPFHDGSPPQSALLDPYAKRSYDTALQLVSAKEYSKGLESLAAFLVKWPDHPYADHAIFWRAQCYFALGDFTRASEEFQGLLSRFPASAKAPDALLTLGLCYQKLGRQSQARESFDRLARDFPQADAAHRIPPTGVPAAPPSAPAFEDHR